MSLEAITFILGCGLIIIAIVGGGIEAKEVKVPKLSPLPRLLSAVFGIILMAGATGAAQTMMSWKNAAGAGNEIAEAGAGAGNETAEAAADNSAAAAAAAGNSAAAATSVEAECPAPGFEGIWHGDDGGTYRIYASGSEIRWVGRSADDGQSWVNRFVGTREGHVLTGDWEDVGSPGGRGTLTINMDEDDLLVRTASTGSPFGGTRWTRPVPIHGCTDNARHPG